MTLSSPLLALLLHLTPPIPHCNFYVSGYREENEDDGLGVLVTPLTFLTTPKVLVGSSSSSFSSSSSNASPLPPRQSRDDISSLRCVSKLWSRVLLSPHKNLASALTVDNIRFASIHRGGGGLPLVYMTSSISSSSSSSSSSRKSLN